LIFSCADVSEQSESSLNSKLLAAQALRNLARKMPAESPYPKQSVLAKNPPVKAQQGNRSHYTTNKDGHESIPSTAFADTSGQRQYSDL
jgi:hypothetical protein